MNMPATFVFVLLLVVVAFVGWFAARWRAADLGQLEEWGLGGRRFGTIVTWFLLGGDLYTAYTFIAVPAVVFAIGAAGFFAVPYCVIAFPLAFVVLPRLWQVARTEGLVTAADIVLSRFGSRTLAFLIAGTGIVATLPYIALQLAGMEVVIGALGFPTSGFGADLPLLVAFTVLAVFTWHSGLRAPALISVIKDLLIYVTIAVAAIVLPPRLGGFAQIFAAVPASKLLLKAPDATSLGGYSAYITLAIGSALAVFLYPHSMTAVLSSNSARTVRRNMALLPAYSLMLGFLALLGYMALRAGVENMPEYVPYFRTFGPNFAVPALFMHFFPSWFVGFAFAAIAIGACVPAAIMSIAAANLYTRNVHKSLLDRTMTSAREALIAKRASLIVKLGAAAFALGMPTSYAIQLQLLGGIWMIQTLPAIVLGLYWRSLDPRGLIAGWVVGIGIGTWMALQLKLTTSTYVLHVLGYHVAGYVAIWSLIANVVVSVVASALLSAVRLRGSRPGNRASKRHSSVWLTSKYTKGQSSGY